MKFQMFKLVLEKPEEPEIKLPTSAGSSKKAIEFQKNIYFCLIDYAKAFDCMGHNKLWKTERDGNTRPPDLPLESESESEVTQSCPTLSDPIDCRPPGSSIDGIFQARVLEWGAIA